MPGQITVVEEKDWPNIREEYTKSGNRTHYGTKANPVPLCKKVGTSTFVTPVYLKVDCAVCRRLAAKLRLVPEYIPFTRPEGRRGPKPGRIKNGMGVY